MKRFLTALACLAIPTFATAAPVTMQCVVKGDGWIADQIFFEYDEARNFARVVDGIILNFEKAPKVAEISEDSAKKLVLNWRVNTRVGRQTTKMSYRLALFKGTNKVLVRAHPHGFVNNYTARGRCQQINQSLPTG